MDGLDQLEKEFARAEAQMKGKPKKSRPELNPVDIDKTGWTEAGEDVLAAMSERAAAFRWMHHDAMGKYKRLDAKFQLPVIVISSLTGGISLSLGSLVPEANQTMASSIVGVLNLLVGIVSSVGQYTKAGALSEGHRTASIAWGRMCRELTTELQLEPHLRSEDQETLIRSTISTYNNLCEQGPVLDRKTVAQFKAEFGGEPLEPAVNRPEIVSGPVRVRVYGRAETVTPLARRNTGMWGRGLKALGLRGKKNDDGDTPASSPVVMT